MGIYKYTDSWTEKELRHLLRRVLYGVSDQDIKTHNNKTMDESLALLFETNSTSVIPIYHDNDDSEIPYGTTPINVAYKADSEENRMLHIKSWYIGLLRNDTSIQGRMAMFWHNHFSTEFNTVKDSRYNYRYFELIHKNATGNFKVLLRDMTTNAQMLVYLNGNSNIKGRPNENYARELQELFTIGKELNPHYTEDDVKNAARVLTGWKDDKEGIRTYFDAESHDAEDKTFSSFYNFHVIRGRSGSDGVKELDDLIEMICNHQETSKFLCRKLYRWFVSSEIDETIEKEVIVPLANMLYTNGYEIEPVLKTLLSAEFFYSPKLVGSIIKSPVDFTIELLRTCSINNPFELNADWRIWAIFSQMTSAMGQDVSNPPSVAGWPAYYEYPLYDKDWISSSRLFDRHKLIKILTDEINPLDPESNVRIDVWKLVESLKNPADSHDILSQILNQHLCVPIGENTENYFRLILDPREDARESWKSLWSKSQKDLSDESTVLEISNRIRNLMLAIFTLPEYQLR